MAERKGFEPSVRSPAHTLSKRAPSTTRPPLRIIPILANFKRTSRCIASCINYVRSWLLFGWRHPYNRMNVKRQTTAGYRTSRLEKALWRWRCRAFRARRNKFDDKKGRIYLHHGANWLRKDHAPQYPRVARPFNRRRIPPRRRVCRQTIRLAPRPN